MLSRGFAILLAVLAVTGSTGQAETAKSKPRPFPEFSAKRIKPPAAGTSKRITVQIEPRATPAVTPQTADTDDKSAAGVSDPGNYGWFWDKISPELAKSGPGRLEQAMQTIAARGDVPAPRLQDLQNIAQDNGIPILRATVGTRVSPALVLAVIAVESAGRSDAQSGAGAQGLMQLMPDTADRFGVEDAFVASENIGGGVRYLDWLMGEFNNDPILVLAGYNAGEGSVRTYDGVPPFAETRDYVPKVLSAFRVARGLCKTPPELISDGCVFATMN